MERIKRPNLRASRKRTSTGLLITEIQDDEEVGYDADVETLKPDAIEEPDSAGEKDDASSSSISLSLSVGCDEHDRRDDLVKEMGSLSCTHNPITTYEYSPAPDRSRPNHGDDNGKSGGRSRKRRSTSADATFSGPPRVKGVVIPSSPTGSHLELEVTEVVIRDDYDLSGPRVKRIRRKGGRQISQNSPSTRGGGCGGIISDEFRSQVEEAAEETSTENNDTKEDHYYIRRTTTSSPAPSYMSRRDVMELD